MNRESSISKIATVKINDCQVQIYPIYLMIGEKNCKNPYQKKVFLKDENDISCIKSSKLKLKFNDDTFVSKPYHIIFIQL